MRRPPLHSIAGENPELFAQVRVLLFERADAIMQRFHTGCDLPFSEAGGDMLRAIPIESIQRQLQDPFGNRTVGFIGQTVGQFAICTKRDFLDPAIDFQPRAVAIVDQDQNGIARMQDSISALATGDWLTLTAFYRCVTSEALISIGELTQAEICLRQALSDRRLREERWCHSELLRVSGILRAHQGDSAQARSLFDRAKRSARRIGAVALEARADQALLSVS